MAGRARPPVSQDELLKNVVDAVEKLFDKQAQNLKFVDVNRYVSLMSLFRLTQHACPELLEVLGNSWPFHEACVPAKCSSKLAVQRPEPDPLFYQQRLQTCQGQQWSTAL